MNDMGNIYYENLYDALETLTTEEIIIGCDTFVENGMREHVLHSELCFLAQIYGVQESMDMQLSENDTIRHPTVLISAGHYCHPEYVFLICCDILERRK